MRDITLEQKVIDPLTGEDITGQYINERLQELDNIADDLIKKALEEYQKSPIKKQDIYQKYYREIHQKLGMGSIGPATGATSPLMQDKKEKLAHLLNIVEDDRIN